MSDQTAMPLPAIMPVRARSFPGSPAQVGQARAFTAAVFRGCPAAPDAVLLVSELAANAVAYSASGQPDGWFTVRACLFNGSGAYAEVEDQGSKWDGNISDAESPHGLYLLRELSADCGVRSGPEGWITWFTINGTPTE
jgi:anti-sigma regulatory factor (Ser/Thr protein kinase)